MVTNWLEEINWQRIVGGFLTLKAYLQHGYSTENKIECAIFLVVCIDLAFAGLMPAYGSENRICILDEPSEGLDENSVQTLVEHISSLRARGSAFLIATHDQRLHQCATPFQS